MANLKPGVKYIYEKANGITYAREFGANPNARVAVGWDYDVNSVSENLLWADIRITAKEHPSLQKILDNAILVYRLIKNNPA